MGQSRTARPPLRSSSSSVLNHRIHLKHASSPRKQLYRVGASWLFVEKFNSYATRDHSRATHYSSAVTVDSVRGRSFNDAQHAGSTLRGLVSRSSVGRRCDLYPDRGGLAVFGLRDEPGKPRLRRVDDRLLATPTGTRRNHAQRSRKSIRESIAPYTDQGLQNGSVDESVGQLLGQRGDGRAFSKR